MIELDKEQQDFVIVFTAILILIGITGISIILGVLLK